MGIVEIGKRIYPTRVITYFGEKPEGHPGQWGDVKWMATKFTPPFKPMPNRPFVMACRPLCRLDLRYPHFTCFTFCRIRRVYYGKMPAVNEIAGVYTITVLKHRRLASVKDIFMMKILGPLMELCAN